MGSTVGPPHSKFLVMSQIIDYEEIIIVCYNFKTNSNELRMNSDSSYYFTILLAVRLIGLSPDHPKY